MTDFHDIESTLTDLEGASHALNNVVQSPDITIEVACGLQWLAWQIDGFVSDLREKWDKQRGPTREAMLEKLRTVKE